MNVDRPRFVTTGVTTDRIIQPRVVSTGVTTDNRNSLTNKRKTMNTVVALIAVFLLAITIGFGVYVQRAYNDLLGQQGSTIVDVSGSVWARTALSFLLIGGAAMIVLAGYLMCDTFGNEFKIQRYVLGATGVMNILLVWLFVIKPTSAFTLLIGSVINGIANAMTALTWGFAAFN